MAEFPELNLDDLSPEERANLSANLNRIRLNDSQAILQAPYSVGQPYTYEKPKGFGGALKNIGRNVARPYMERLGLTPSIQGQIANMRYDDMRRDIAGEQAELARDQMLRESLIASGAPESTVKGLYGKGLQDFAMEFQGAETTRGDGSSYQINPLTNAQTAILDPSPERREYNRYSGSLRAPNRLLTEQEYRAQGKGLGKAATDQAQEDVLADNFYKKYRREQTTNFATGIYANAKSSQNSLPNLYMMRDMIGDPDLDQGEFAKVRLAAKSIMMDLGFDVEGDISNEIFFRSASNKLAIAGRSTDAGGGMPGSMSDSDRGFLVEMVPQLTNVAGGNALIIESMIALSERNIAVRDEQDNYFRKNKTLDGIEQHLDQKFRGKDFLTKVMEKATRLLESKSNNGSPTLRVD